MERVAMIDRTHLVFISSIFGSENTDYKAILPRLTEEELALMESDEDAVEFFFRYKEGENIYMINGIDIFNQSILHDAFSLCRTIKQEEIGPDRKDLHAVTDMLKVIVEMVNTIRGALSLKKLSQKDRIILCIHWGGDLKSESKTYSQNLERCFYFWGNTKVWCRSYTKSNKMYATLFMNEEITLEQFFVWGYQSHFIDLFSRFAHQIGHHIGKGEGVFQTQDDELVFLWENNRDDFIHLWDIYKEAAQVTKSLTKYISRVSSTVLKISDVPHFHEDCKKIEKVIRDFLCSTYDTDCP